MILGHYSQWVSPFRHHRIIGCLAPPRCLSQLTTSFFASQRQGIHLVALIILSLKNFLSFPIQLLKSLNIYHVPRSLLDDFHKYLAKLTRQDLPSSGGGEGI